MAGNTRKPRKPVGKSKRFGASILTQVWSISQTKTKGRSETLRGSYCHQPDPQKSPESKTRSKNPWISLLWLSLSPHPFEKLRPHACSPHRDEGKHTIFSRLYGRNRKTRSALSQLLSSVSLSSGVGLTCHKHPRTYRSKAKLLVPFWWRDVAKGGMGWSKMETGRWERSGEIWDVQALWL